MQATATAQPNIALIKYWGKRELERNLPAVGSISVTLESLRTSMQVSFTGSADFLEVNGEPRPDLLPRIGRCLDRVAGVGRPAARIVSHSNFPLGAGLASSASAFAALTVAASAAAGLDHDTESLARLAGCASGSAARSIRGGIVELVNRRDRIETRELASPEDWPLRVIAAVTDPGPKPVGSTEAMEISRRTSPFYSRWLADQDEDLAAARAAIDARDFSALAAVAEHNCLKMHSVMWSSRPATVFWNAATLRCLEAIRALQRAGQAVFFTIDAGPQVKAICLPEAAGAVEAALRDCDGVQALLVSGLGRGARLDKAG